MDIIIYTLLLINIALLLVVYRIYNLYTYVYLYEGTPYYKYKYTYFDNIEDKLDTGDLLLFSSYEFSAIRVLSNARFSHAAIVIKKEGKLFGIDMIDNDFVAPGITVENLHIFNIKERIQFYSGFVYLCKYNKIIDNVCRQKIENELNNYDIMYPDKNTLIKKYLINYKSSNTKNLKSCVEYVVHLLEIGDIVDLKDSKISNYMHNILLISNGHTYSKPVRLLVKDREFRNNNYIKNLCKK